MKNNYAIDNVNLNLMFVAICCACLLVPLKTEHFFDQTKMVSGALINKQVVASFGTRHTAFVRHQICVQQTGMREFWLDVPQDIYDSFVVGATVTMCVFESADSMDTNWRILKP